MLVLINPGKHNLLLVKPRWPSTKVGIDSEILTRLHHVSEKLPQGIQLVLTRGYESPDGFVGRSRTLLRLIGRKIFALIYPSRHSEIEEIFSPNGHDINGLHIDIGISKQGQQLSLLPLGVFTSPTIVERHENTFREVIQLVQSYIVSAGGKFHSNRLEALQMHVDFAESSSPAHDIASAL